MVAHFKRTCLTTALTLALCASAQAKPENVTDGEMALLPPYCVDTMGFKYGDAYSNTSPRAGHWISLMGKGFWGMHHYCWGLINLNRVRTGVIPKNAHDTAYKSIVGDFQYVLRNAPADFVMAPEINYRIGEVSLLHGRPMEAYDAFLRARQQKPDYWPAYVKWAEVLMASKKNSEALALVEEGLKHAPQAKALLDLQARLGGKPRPSGPTAKPAEPAASAAP